MKRKPRGPYQAHTNKEIKRLEGSNRLCPNSLREIFNHIRETASDEGPLNHLAFVKDLNKAWHGPRYGVTKFTTALFETTEGGNHRLKYFQIEAYARELGIPSGLLLMFSRLHAELTHNSPVEALAVAEGVFAALEDCRERILETGGFDVRSAVAAYLKVSPPASAAKDSPVDN